MQNGLNIQRLAALDAKIALLSAGRYALPVRFRVRGAFVECQIPTWSGVGDLPGEAALVIIEEAAPALRWLFIRGPATVVAEPDWAELHPPDSGRIALDELYQLLRITPKRMELIDEQRGWGCRETADL